MCKTGKTLKLCTCSDKIDKSKPHWTLARKTIKQPDTEVIMGMYMPSESFCDRNFAQTEEWLLSQINEYQCFDFNYSPFPEDKLLINLGEDEFGFVYSLHEQAWEAIDLDYPFSEKIKRSVQAKGYVEQEGHAV